MHVSAIGARCAALQHGCEVGAACAVVGASGRQRCDREIGSDRELGSARAHRVVASSEIAASDSIMRAGAARAAACARESPAVAP